MAKSNFFFVLIACFLSLALVADSHVGGKRLGDSSAASKIEDIALHERSDFHDKETNLEHTLLKRGQLFLDAVAPDDANILQQAFTDMVAVVTYVSRNPNSRVLKRYFAESDQADVTAMFNAVRQMAQVGGFPNPMKPLKPTDLNQIHVTRPKGVGLTLAASFDTGTTPTNAKIEVYDFGWRALWKKLRSQVKCCDITKTNYKMHILGTLLLHEVLHFNSVTNLAWVQGTSKKPLEAAECLDDQPGNFLGTGKAYGPYEAMQLLQRDPTMAKLNIENYIWYALETYWMNECPNAPRNAQRLFPAASSNDIPAACIQGVKGVANGLC